MKRLKKGEECGCLGGIFCLTWVHPNFVLRNAGMSKWWGKTYGMSKWWGKTYYLYAVYVCVIQDRHCLCVLVNEKTPQHLPIPFFSS